MTTLYIANNSKVHFQGWLRTNVDVMPPHPQGSTPEANYLLGNRTGLDTYNLDVYTSIAPGERRTIDLTTATPMDYHPHAGIQPNVCAWGGIPVTVAGQPLTFLGAVENGAAFDGHWRGRITLMLVVDLFVTWYPDDPGMAVGEIIITASNPAVQDVIAPIPPELRLVFGDAIVMVPGLPDDALLMQRGDWLADGQPRLPPLVLCWPRHDGNLELCRAVADQQVQVCGIERLHADGNPPLPAGFDAAAWAMGILPEVIARQHDWLNSPLDPAYQSGASGAQGSQSFVAGPAMADPLAVGPFYLGALDASWPMFHLEADGSQLDWKAHPGLRMFYGRVNRAISGDTLGKERDPTSGESHGYAGPEDEHWFDFVLWAGARLKGTPATQWAMRAHAIHFLFRYVVEPPGNWLTANRGVGWMCFLVAELYRNLADRELAEAVKQRFRDLADQLILPQMTLPGDAWWGWTEDVRIGASPGHARAVPWQASVLALGLRAASIACDHNGAYALAIDIGEKIVGRAWVEIGGRWTSRTVIAQDGNDPPGEVGYYDFFGSPMAVACVLLHNPTHGIAGAIWRQLEREATRWGMASWLAPGVKPS